MSARPLPVLLAAALVALGLPALANHTQTEGGKTLAFDHVTGNEWWVEVKLTGPDAPSVAKVEAQDDNSPWTALAKKSWGPYAASFHIEPGNLVRFRATFPDGVQVVSCPFTHPAGVEEQAEGLCAGSSSSSTTSSATTTTTVVTDPCEAFSTCPALDATFKGVRGNEWWVQATVNANKALGKVEATLDGGATYKPLAKQSWGGHAASFRIVQGSVVQLRATATDGSTDLSACYQWIPAKDTDARIVACPGGSSPSPSPSPSGSASRSPSASPSPSGSPTSSTTTTTQPPPKVWRARTVADVPGVHDQVFADDLGADGQPNIVLIGDDGVFQVVPPPQYGSAAQLDMGSWWQGQIGNADNDIPRDLYVVGLPHDSDHFTVRQLQFNTDYRGYLQYPVHTSHDPLGPVHVTDLDGDGLQELYVGHDILTESGSNATLDFVHVGYTVPQPHFRQVVDLGDGGRGFLTILGLASGSVGGVPMMYALAVTFDDAGNTENQVFALQHADGGLLTAQWVATFAGDAMFFDAFDIDGDGSTDVVSATEDGLAVVLAKDGAWALERAALPMFLFDAEAGDMDGDGAPELYVAADDGRIHRLRRVAAGAYQTQAVLAVATTNDLAGPYHLHIGNGDADAGPEMYALALKILGPDSFATRVLEVTFDAQTFDATFSGVKGNNWWVQASVSATAPLAGVDARVDCGAWKPLTKQSYGWSASFHVPTGAKVDFRARGTSGATDLSGGYIWPNATPAAGC